MSSRTKFSHLREAVPAVLPSLLLCDFGNLEREIRQLEEAGVKALHLDVMDGVFVPNLTYGMPIVEACRRLTDLPIDAHLMIAHPEHYLEAFKKAGADNLTIHVEAVSDPGMVLGRIRELGMAAGIALNPGTALERITGCLGLVDLVLVMSVDAGFGGQSFKPVAWEKLAQLRDLVGNEVLLQVDGGVNRDTIARCAQAGAELFVVGSAIFRKSDYGLAVRELTELAAASN